MKPSLKISFLLFFLFSINRIYSQKSDSLKLIADQYDAVLNTDDNFLEFLFYKNYKDVLLNNLGPFGSPHYYLLTEGLYSDSPLLRKDSVKMKLRQLKKIKPFTNISYINGSRKEQGFSIEHLQHLGNLLSFEFDYKRKSSLGSYINQFVNTSDFEGDIRFDNKSNRYHLEFSTLLNHLKLQENGGIIDTLEFETNSSDNRKTYSVNLLNSNSLAKERKFVIDQKFDLRKKRDSINRPSYFVGLTSFYDTYKRVFYDNDPSSAIYNSSRVDSVPSIDSIYRNNISNKIYFGASSKSFNANFFGKYDVKNYLQSTGIDTSYNNVFTGLDMSWKRRSINIELMGVYGIEGYRKEDVKSNLKIDYLFGKERKNKFFVKLKYDYSEPTLKDISYSSNHFIWNNSYKKQTIFEVNGGVKIDKWDLNVEADNKIINDILYYDASSLPQQGGNVSISTFSIKKNYKLLNFHFRTALFYQLTSDKVILPLPNFMARQVLYYQKEFFKKVLKMQIGVNAFYSTEYYGYSYMPATSVFYIQSNKKMGNYPYLDFFINAHVKRAQIFVMYEHFNSGWLGYDYYSTPNYPTLDRYIKLGISWNMFN